MKNSTFCFLIIVFVMVVACNKDNKVKPIFDKSVNERAAELKSEYIKTLSDPENGWLGYYNPNPRVGSYTLLLKFKEDGSVLMKSGYNNGANDAEITYRIDKTLKMELVFESHSVLHAIFEINNNNHEGEYVFNIVSIDDNEVVFKSKTDNGYRGKVTELRLRKATSADWDLAPIYTSIKNLEGDMTKSVFRTIYVNDIAIAALDNFSGRRRTVNISYMEGGKLAMLVEPVNITPNGFSFIDGLTIGATTLSGFVYSSATSAFVDTKNNAKIVYDNVPAIPLAPYNFGSREIRYNYVETTKSSKLFNNFYNEFLKSAKQQGLDVTRIYFRDWKKDLPFVHIYANENSLDIKIRYYINYEKRTDGKVYFTLTGRTRDSNSRRKAILQPLLDVIVGSTKGYHIRGTLLNINTRNTVSLINADNPAYEINYYDFGDLL